jgi:hypothetical protein
LEKRRLNYSASTLNYIEYQKYQVPSKVKQKPKVSSTTNEYIDISNRQFISHILKLAEISSNKLQLSEGTEEPSKIAIQIANLVIKQLEKSEFPPAEIVPSAEGGVAFCFIDGDRYADIECLNSGEILGVTTNRRDRPSVWEIQLNQSEIARATERIRSFITK